MKKDREKGIMEAPSSFRDGHVSVIYFVCCAREVNSKRMKLDLKRIMPFAESKALELISMAFEDAAFACGLQVIA